MTLKDCESINIYLVDAVESNEYGFRHHYRIDATTLY